MSHFFSDNKRPITFFVFTSLLLHLLIFILFRQGLDKLIAAKTPEPPPVWVELKNMDLPQRIADIPRPTKEEIPDKASAQALYNQKVPEETVNPLPPARAEMETPAPTAPSPPTEAKKESKSFDELYALRSSDRMEDIFKTEPPTGRPAPQPKMPGLPEAEPGPVPSPGDDYFPDYKIGGHTYLNTLANPNIRYFVELKRKFKLTFNPAPALRGRINEISRGQIDVVLGVSVNQNGDLADLIVIRSSGIEGYDKEGLRTVRSSAPFSAPPANFLEPDGMIHMAWTFIVYL